MKRKIITFGFALFQILAISSGSSPLAAQCNVPPGAYEITLALPQNELIACPDSATTLEVRVNPLSPPISGFGFNLLIEGARSIRSVQAGFEVGSAGGFKSHIEGNQVCAVGFINPGNPPLSLLARVEFTLDRVAAPQNRSIVFFPFGTGLALPTGFIPANHLVHASTGCDVLPPALALRGATFRALPCARAFIRGDCNGDGRIDTPGSIADARFLLEFYFDGGSTPPCIAACDVDDNGSIESANAINDAIYLLRFNFYGDPPPPAPFPACGVDPTADSLTCDAYESCE